jgi:hypothetical protein
MSSASLLIVNGPFRFSFARIENCVISNPVVALPLVPVYTPTSGAQSGNGSAQAEMSARAEHGHCAARFLPASRNGKVIFPSWLGLERSS